MIQKFPIARDETLYHAWPDVTLTRSGKLVCVFSECISHGDRSYSRLMLTSSTDRGRTWMPRRPLSEALHKSVPSDPYWNCARVSMLRDGRLCAIGDRIAGAAEGSAPNGEQSNWLWLSEDEGQTWSEPQPTPAQGIVPDKVVELKNGTWLISAHAIDAESGVWQQRCWRSDDEGATWLGPYIVAAEPGLKLCEGSILELPGGELVCFLRENSFVGRDAFKCISRDGGLSWSKPVEFPLPACHRPVAGLLQSGQVLITHRFMQGGSDWNGWWMQNLFAGYTDVESCLASTRDGARTRIVPIDYDRSPRADCGYSGWVQFPDGEIYVVHYIVDDAPKAQIRGYAFQENDIILDCEPC